MRSSYALCSIYTAPLGGDTDMNNGRRHVTRLRSVSRDAASPAMGAGLETRRESRRSKQPTYATWHTRENDSVSARISVAR
jgi:hypothetical protein